MSVIFSRAPLRISLGGGGTDLPSYYREHGGFLVSGAIDKYIYMLTHTVFQRRYRMKYSELEEVDEIEQIRHPILREGLLRHWCGSPLEIASVADVPAGTGMGSSGAYTVCLIKGLIRARHSSISPGDLAEEACGIEMDVLGEPVGKQDPYVAAHGGICAYTFDPGGAVSVEPLELDSTVLRRLRDQLLLFYTGEARSASKMLADQDERSKAGETQMLENLHRTKELGRRDPQAAGRRRSRRLRRVDARALGTQAPPLSGDERRAHRSALYIRAAAAARSEASWWAPAAVDFCSSTVVGRRTPGRRWRPPAPQSWRSTSSSAALTRVSTYELTTRGDSRLRSRRDQARRGAGAKRRPARLSRCGRRGGEESRRTTWRHSVLHVG